MKKPHGGPGRNQGRKKDPNKKVKISPSVRPEFKKMFSEYAKKINESQGDIITRLVEEEIENKMVIK